MSLGKTCVHARVCLHVYVCVHVHAMVWLMSQYLCSCENEEEDFGSVHQALCVCVPVHVFMCVVHITTQNYT